jgi:hypothetical protein
VASSIVLATLLTGPLSMIFGTLAYQEMVGSAPHPIDSAGSA